MPRRLIFKEGNNLSSIGPIQSGYKMVAYEGGTFSQKVGGTVSAIGGNTLPYKVYTALLTQSGTSNEGFLTSGTLTIGVTYYIAGIIEPGDDFTNVGAPNNNYGTTFVATGTTPAVWTHGTELDYDAGAPVVKVLENTIGNIWFFYNDVGNYSVNSNNLFTINKTYILFGGFYGGENWINNYGNSSIIELVGSNNGVLSNMPIEIRVYN